MQAKYLILGALITPAVVFGVAAMERGNTGRYAVAVAADQGNHIVVVRIDTETGDVTTNWTTWNSGEKLR